MGPSTLVPCASCGQHVRDEETQCPFCGTRRVPGVRPVALTPRIDERVMMPMYGGPPRPPQGNAVLLVALALAVTLAIAGGAVALLLLR